MLCCFQFYFVLGDTKHLDSIRPIGRGCVCVCGGGGVKGIHKTFWKSKRLASQTLLTIEESPSSEVVLLLQCTMKGTK